jgi:HAE1 family hydrophobic/amphiphilic exporter-1
MILITSSVKRPHTVFVAALLCVMFGWLALTTVPLQLKPSLDLPEITVTTTFRGASPLEVEDQITTPIEEEMDSVEGVKRITSESADGRSVVTLEFDWGVNKDTALIDVINKLNQVPDLPDDADTPIVQSVSSESREPIMWIVMLSESYTPDEMFQVAEDIIEPRFRRVKGVSDLLLMGGEEREMQIRIDPAALVARGISMQEFIAALQRENMNVRGGFIDEEKRRFNLRTVGQFESIEDIHDVIVHRSDAGAVYLHEVAEASFGFKKKESLVRVNGQYTVVFGIKRKSGSNTVEVCRGVADAVEALNADFANRQEDLNIQIVYTDVDYIDQSIDVAWRNLLFGALLASIVLIFFLKSLRSLVIVALTIPICMITVFIFIKFFDRSLNIISLAGLAFSAGMIVDNAIVVIENIYRHLAMKKTRIEAAVDGTQEVWGAILISTLTTLAVFIPVIFIQEEAGQLFKDIAIAICVAIALSLLAAITVIPMLSGLLLDDSHDKEPSPLRQKAAAIGHLVTLTWLGRIVARVYDAIIDKLVGNSPVKVLMKLAVVAAFGLLFWQSFKFLPPAEYLPSGNRNLVLIFADPLVGSNLEKSVTSIRPLEMMIENDERVERYFTVFGGQFNAVGFIVKPEHADEIGMRNLVGEYFGRTRGIAGFKMLFPIQATIFRDPGKQLEVDISGPDLVRLEQTAGAMQGQLFGTEGVQFVRSSFQSGSPEVRVELDRKRAAALNLRVAEAADFVESLVAGKRIGNFNDTGSQIDLTLYALSGLVDTRGDLAAMQLVTPEGKTIRLDSVAQVRTTTGPTAVKHVEKERAITLTVNLKPEASLEESIARIESQVFAPTRRTMPVDYSIRLAGTADKLNSTLTALTDSFALAIIIVYLLMVALFRSFLYPLIILVTIPMAMSGAFFAIAVQNQRTDGLIVFDVIAMLGLIILAGIVVNNAILIVHQTLNFREAGHSPSEALRLSTASRLRPIWMSVTTSVLGMLPLAVGGGAGTELYRSLGTVLLGGLLLSTVFTLFLVPALLSLLQDLQALVGGSADDGLAAPAPEPETLPGSDKAAENESD